MNKKELLIRRPNITTRKINGLNVILDYEKSTVIEFNEIGSLIWDLSFRETNLDKIISETLKIYNIDEHTVDRDVRDFFLEYRDLFVNPDKVNFFATKIRKFDDIVSEQLEQIGLENTIPVFTEIELTKNCNLTLIRLRSKVFSEKYI